MTKNNSIKEAYPISINGQQCVGPCYYSNTKIIHPLVLDEIKDVKYNFCPVNTFVYTDPSTKKESLSIIDRCLVPTSSETMMDNLLRDNIIAPQFYFSSEYFVKVYYKINNLEDLLKWLDLHKTDPYKTKERVFNNGMIVYGNDVSIVDHRMVQFVNDTMIFYLPNLYQKIRNYIHVTDDQIKLGYEESYDTNKEDIGLIRSYIKEKFLGSDGINQFMSKFIRYYKSDLTSKNLSIILVNTMADYIIKRIKLTVEEI